MFKFFYIYPIKRGHTRKKIYDYILYIKQYYSIIYIGTLVHIDFYGLSSPQYRHRWKRSNHLHMINVIILTFQLSTLYSLAVTKAFLQCMTFICYSCTCLHSTNSVQSCVLIKQKLQAKNTKSDTSLKLTVQIGLQIWGVCFFYPSCLIWSAIADSNACDVCIADGWLTKTFTLINLLNRFEHQQNSVDLIQNILLNHLDPSTMNLSFVCSHKASMYFRSLVVKLSNSHDGKYRLVKYFNCAKEILKIPYQIMLMMQFPHASCPYINLNSFFKDFSFFVLKCLDGLTA